MLDKLLFVMLAARVPVLRRATPWSHALASPQSHGGDHASKGQVSHVLRGGLAWHSFRLLSRAVEPPLSNPSFQLPPSP